MALCLSFSEAQFVAIEVEGRAGLWGTQGQEWGAGIYQASHSGFLGSVVSSVNGINNLGLF